MGLELVGHQMHFVGGGQATPGAEQTQSKKRLGSLIRLIDMIALT
jgi:hypothetical protein